ncbi:C-Jun-amino-terminal kinase-interacting protein 4-like [Hippocampus comes]|uniref:C-Jun-amino-terminal kinase-interacting protein 4-like n=2 Tax=Hippocampus comes TaxID=109280 RepID=UPI00094EA618|nr:PREDICTED: C-Jun-amino-terminal kinase-interacting protein 4-like [Hippocampus comes]
MELDDVVLYQDDSCNSTMMSERVSDLASSIYREFERLIAKYDEDVVKELMPLVVAVLENLDSVFAVNQEHEVELELLKEDNEQLVTQYEREKSLRKHIEERYIANEDSLDGERKDLKGRVATLESHSRQLELKTRNYADQIIRFEEREAELKKEYSALHQRHTEMIHSYMDHLERTRHQHTVTAEPSDSGAGTSARTRGAMSPGRMLLFVFGFVGGAVVINSAILVSLSVLLLVHYSVATGGLPALPSLSTIQRPSRKDRPISMGIFQVPGIDGMSTDLHRDPVDVQAEPWRFNNISHPRSNTSLKDELANMSRDGPKSSTPAKEGGVSKHVPSPAQGGTYKTSTHVSQTGSLTTNSTSTMKSGQCQTSAPTSPGGDTSPSIESVATPQGHGDRNKNLDGSIGKPNSKSISTVQGQLGQENEETATMPHEGNDGKNNLEKSEVLAIIESTPELDMDLDGCQGTSTPTKGGVENLAFDRNTDSLFEELSSAGNDYIGDVDDGADLLGMGREVEHLIQENAQLLETKNALNVVKNDLIARMDELSCEKEVLQGELDAVTQAKIRLEEKNKDLEDELKKVQAELGNSKHKSKTENEDDSDVPTAQRKRFTRVEMARVLMERNQYKERLMELQEAVRWTEMIRIHVYPCNCYLFYGGWHANNLSPTFNCSNPPSAGATACVHPSIRLSGCSFFPSLPFPSLPFPRPPPCPYNSSFSRLFSSSGGASKKPPAEAPVNVKYNAPTSHIQPSVKKRSSALQQLPSDKSKAFDFLNEELAVESMVSRREQKRAQYQQVKAHVQKGEEGRLQACGWSLPKKHKNNGGQEEMKDLPVPVFLRPLDEKDASMKLWCAAGVHLSGGKTRDGGSIVGASVFYSNVSGPESPKKKTGSQSSLEKLDQELKEQQKELRQHDELSSLVWICTSTQSTTKAVVIDANQPGIILDSFIVCDAHVLCITSVPGARETDYPAGEELTLSSETAPVEKACLSNSSSSTASSDGVLGGITVVGCTAEGATAVPQTADGAGKENGEMETTEESGGSARQRGVYSEYAFTDPLGLQQTAEASTKSSQSYHLLDLGKPHYSIRCMTVVHDKVWCGFRNKIYVVQPKAMKIEKSFDAHPRKESQVRQLAWDGDGIWVSIRLDSTLRLFHAHTFQHLQDVDIEPYVSKMLGTGKLGFSFVRITALMVSCNRLWIGTGNGVIISIPLVESEY